MFGERLGRTLSLAGLSLLAFAITVNAQNTRPDTIDEAVAAVRQMREEGAPNERIAWYVAHVVDHRMTNGNSAEGFIARTVWYYTDADRWNLQHRFDAERDSVAGRTQGRSYVDLARWAWDLQWGQCNEAAAMSYYILHTADVPVRIRTVPNKHVFAVIGVDGEDEDLSDPRTWGEDAWIVDGWVGGAIRSSRMWNYRALRATRYEEATAGFDDPGQYEAQETLRGLENLNITVLDDRGEPVRGATVTVEGPETRTLPTSEAGLAAFSLVKEGGYGVTVAPPATRPLLPTTESISVQPLRMRQPNTLTLHLEARPIEPFALTVRVFDEAYEPVPGAAVSVHDGLVTGTTDESGSLRVELALAEPVVVRATHEELGPGHTSVDLRPPFEAYADVILPGELPRRDGGAADAGAADAGVDGGDRDDDEGEDEAGRGPRRPGESGSRERGSGGRAGSGGSQSFDELGRQLGETFSQWGRAGREARERRAEEERREREAREQRARDQQEQARERARREQASREQRARQEQAERERERRQREERARRERERVRTPEDRGRVPRMNVRVDDDWPRDP